MRFNSKRLVQYYEPDHIGVTKVWFMYETSVILLLKRFQNMTGLGLVEAVVSRCAESMDVMWSLSAGAVVGLAFSLSFVA